MKRLLGSAFFLVLILIFSCALTGFDYVGLVHASTTINGIINTDTTWTKSGSPYTLNGPTAVNNDITLTIEPGVTVNLNGYLLRINGTLNARGTDAENIIFQGQGYLQLMSESTSWNEQTGSGSIIQEATFRNFSGASVILYARNCSPKIIGNTIYGYISLEMRSNATITENTIYGGIYAGAGSPTISKNTLIRMGSDDSSNPEIGITSPAFGIIDNNTISGFKTGISNDLIGSPVIVNNVIKDCEKGIYTVYGSPIIQRNRITGCTDGIFIHYGTITIEGNTITGNTNGISINFRTDFFIPTLSITNNNILQNTYNIKTGLPQNFTVANNYWGTTDTNVIDQKIYDFQDNFVLGTINYNPILTSPNPMAMPNPNTPSSTPYTSALPTPTWMPAPTEAPAVLPTQNPTATIAEPGSQVFLGLDLFQMAVVVLLGAIVVLLLVLVVVMHRRRPRMAV